VAKGASKPTKNDKKIKTKEKKEKKVKSY